MRVIIKEWPNRTATVMAMNGDVVWTFSSVENARQACHDWSGIRSIETILYADQSPEEPESLYRMA